MGLSEPEKKNKKRFCTCKQAARWLLVFFLKASKHPPKKTKNKPTVAQTDPSSHAYTTQIKATSLYCTTSNLLPQQHVSCSTGGTWPDRLVGGDRARLLAPDAEALVGNVR